jgi:hypothetical protein
MGKPFHRRARRDRREKQFLFKTLGRNKCLEGCKLEIEALLCDLGGETVSVRSYFNSWSFSPANCAATLLASSFWICSYSFLASEFMAAA